MTLYGIDNIPKTTSWIHQLDAPSAIAQCEAWGISPAESLEQNRGLLRQFIKLRQPSQENMLKPETNMAAQEPQNLTQKPQPLAHEPKVINVAAALPTITASPHTEETPLPIDPTFTNLLHSIQQMTINSITQTVTTLVRELNPSTPNTRTDDAPLPPYLREMFKELPKTNGANSDLTIDFLKKVDRIVDLKLTSEKIVILNAAPYTTDRFRDFWMEMVASGAVCDQLLENLRQTLFTPDSLRDCQTRLLYRHQREFEGLAEYVRDIQLLFKILSPFTPENEIFNTIFRGINYSTRTTFAGLKPITSIQDLIQIASLSASLLPESSRARNTREFNNHQPARPSNYWGNHQVQPQYSNNWYRNPQQHSNPYRPNFQTNGRNYTPRQQYNSPRHPPNHARGITPGWTDNSNRVNQHRAYYNNPGNLNSNRGGN